MDSRLAGLSSQGHPQVATPQFIEAATLCAYEVITLLLQPESSAFLVVCLSSKGAECRGDVHCRDLSSTIIQEFPTIRGPPKIDSDILYNPDNRAPNFGNPSLHPSDFFILLG